MSEKISRLYVYSSEEEEVLDGNIQIVLPEALEVVPVTIILEDSVGQHRFSMNPELSHLARGMALKAEGTKRFEVDAVS